MLDDLCITKLLSYLEADVHTIAFVNKAYYKVVFANRNTLARKYIYDVYPYLKHTPNAYKNYLRLLYVVYILKGNMRSKANFLLYMDYMSRKSMYDANPNSINNDIYLIISSKYCLQSIISTTENSFLYIHEQLTKKINPHILSPFICYFLLNNTILVSMWNNYEMKATMSNNRYERRFSCFNLLKHVFKIFLTRSVNINVNNIYLLLLRKFIPCKEMHGEFYKNMKHTLNNLILELLLNDNDNIVKCIVQIYISKPNLLNIIFSSFHELEVVGDCNTCFQENIVSCYTRYLDITKEFNYHLVLSNTVLTNLILNYCENNLYILLDWVIHLTDASYTILRPKINKYNSKNSNSCDEHQYEYNYLDYIILLKKISNDNCARINIMDNVIEDIKWDKMEKVELLLEYYRTNEEFYEIVKDSFSQIIQYCIKTCLDIDNTTILIKICEFYTYYSTVKITDKNKTNNLIDIKDIIKYVITYAKEINRHDIVSDFKKINI